MHCTKKYMKKIFCLKNIYEAYPKERQREEAQRRKNIEKSQSEKVVPQARNNKNYSKLT